MVNLHSFLRRTGGTVAVAFLQNKLIDKVFDHEKQTKDPRNIKIILIYIKTF